MFFRRLLTKNKIDRSDDGEDQTYFRKTFDLRSVNYPSNTREEDSGNIYRSADTCQQVFLNLVREKLIC